MKKKNRGIKRSDRIQGRQGGNLVYKRTEIDKEEKRDISKIYYALVGITLTGIIYLVFFSGAFNVNQVNINGTRDVEPENIRSEVEKRLSSEILKDNIFLFDSSSVSRELKREYALKNIKIKKYYPNKIDVSLDEYVIELNWLSGGRYYYIDEKGKAVGVYTEAREGAPIVEDKKNLGVEVGKSMVTSDFINFIKYLNNNFSSIQGAKLTKIEINESFNEINVYSSLSFYIIFDTTRDPSREINNCITALTSKEISGKKLTYMDMRIENKVFYK